MKLWQLIAWILYIVFWIAFITNPHNFLAGIFFVYIVAMSSIILIILFNKGWDYIENNNLPSFLYQEIGFPPAWFMLILIGIIAVFFLSWG